MKNNLEIRIDKWLWHARFFKTRSFSASFIRKQGININGVDFFKPSTIVKVNDILYFKYHNAFRIVKVLIIPCRRVSFDLAIETYHDLSLEIGKNIRTNY